MIAYRTMTFNTVLQQLLQRSGREVINPTVADYPDVAAVLNMRLQEAWNYTAWSFLRKVRVVENWDRVAKGSGLDPDIENLRFKDSGELVQGQPLYRSEPTSSGVIWENYRLPTADKWEVKPTPESSNNSPARWQTDVNSSETGLVTYDLNISTFGTLTMEAWAGETPNRIHVGNELILGVYGEDPREYFFTIPALRVKMVEGGVLAVAGADLDKAYLHYMPEAPDWIADSPVPTVPEAWRQAVIELAYSDLTSQESSRSGQEHQLIEARGYKLLDELCVRLARFSNTPNVSMRRSVPRSIW
jgi:hypothetical protein